jgi:integrase
MFIKRPGKDRKSYAIVDDEGRTIKDPRIDQVNADRAAGLGSADLWEARLREVMGELRPKREPAPLYALSLVNAQLVERWHAIKVMMRDEPHADPENLKQRLLRGAGALGELSIQGASEDQILMALSKVKGAKKHDIVRAVNELLKYAKRGFSIPNPARERDIVFIRPAQFLQLERGGDYKVVLGALFATGCRWAELPLATSKDGGISVRRQIRKDGSVGKTKNKRERLSPILPPLLTYWEEYSSWSEHNKRKMRFDLYNRAYGFCKRKLGVRLHDLRHSYAVEWLASGFSMSEVAKFIGDTEEACQRHYAPFTAQPDEIERAIARYKKHR